MMSLDRLIFVLEWLSRFLHEETMSCHVNCCLEIRDGQLWFVVVPIYRGKMGKIFCQKFVEKSIPIRKNGFGFEALYLDEFGKLQIWDQVRPYGSYFFNEDAN